MEYFLLAASKHTATLYLVSGDDITKQDVAGMPGGMDDVTAGNDTQKSSLQKHGSDSSAVHGHDEKSRIKERDAEEYYRALAHSLKKFISAQGLPLIFAGVPEAFGLFHKYDTSDLLIPDHVEGSPDHVSPEDLKKKADPIAKTYADEHARKYVEEYGNLLGTGRTSDDIGEILNAATAGKVELLLVREGAELWGTIDDDGSVHLSTEKGDGDKDFLSVAVTSTLEHRGKAVSVNSDDMPKEAIICAILRQ